MNRPIGTAGREAGLDPTADSQAVLEQLDQANLFIVALDDRRQWYGYHHLFGDLLRHYLAREAGTESLAQLHQRACLWFQDNGFVEEAVDHASATGDFEQAAAVIEPIAMAITAESKFSMLLGWLARLPADLIAARPWLCIAQAWAYFLTGQINSVPPLLQAAEANLAETTPEILADYHPLYGQIATLRAFMARGQGEFAQSIALSHQAFDHLPQDSPDARSSLSLNLGISYLATGELTAAGSYLAEAATIGQAAGNPFTVLSAINYQANQLVLQSRLHQAAKRYEQTIQYRIAEGGGQPLPGTGYAYVGLAQVLYEWNRLAEAESHLRRGLELGQHVDDVVIMLRGYLALARLRQAQGAWSAATEALNRAQEIASKAARTPEAGQISSWRVRLWLAQDDLAAVSHWAGQREYPTDQTPNYLYIFEHLALARVLIAQGEANEALDLLFRLLRVAEESGRTGSAIEILTLQALAFQIQDDTDRALTSLNQALTLAEPEGYIRLLADEGPPLADLLRKSPPSAYRDRLLDFGFTISDASTALSKGFGSVIPVLAKSPPQSPLKGARLVGSPP